MNAGRPSARRTGRGPSPKPKDGSAATPAGVLIPVKSELVLDLMTFIRTYVVMSPAQILVTALWVIHTHCFEHAEQTPYLSVTSPERRCGKSRLLEVLALLVHKPWNTIIPSEAVLYRRIHSYR